MSIARRDSASEELQVTSQQSTSTPGMKYKDTITLNASTTYEYNVTGYKSSSSFDVKLRVETPDGSLRLVPSSTYVVSEPNGHALGTSETHLSVKFTTPNYDIDVKVYVLKFGPPWRNHFVWARRKVVVLHVRRSFDYYLIQK